MTVYRISWKIEYDGYILVTHSRLYKDINSRAVNEKEIKEAARILGISNYLDITFDEEEVNG